MYLLQAAMGAGMVILGLLTILVLIGIPVLTIIFKISSKSKEDNPVENQIVPGKKEDIEIEKNGLKEEVKSWTASLLYAVFAIITILVILFFLFAAFGPKDFE